jgi:hypothetical protein
MPPLPVPPSQLFQKGVPVGVAPLILEEPVDVHSAAPLFPDGAPFDGAVQEQGGAAGFLVYRAAAPGAMWEVWNGAAGRWQASAEAVDATLPLQPLTYAAGETLPWRGILVGAGQPKLEAIAPGGPIPFPQYAVRTLFAASRGGLEYRGLGPHSAGVRFAKMTDIMRVGLGMPAGQAPLDAEALMIFLRDAALRTVGSVEIRLDGGTAAIEISNRDSAGSVRARVLLTAAGEIRLRPASGAKVVIEGDLEVGHVTYLPAAGGGPQPL